MRETAALLQDELLAKKITVKFSLEAASPRVFADRVLMQRVLLNLYTNAIEAIAIAKGKSRRIEIVRGSPMARTSFSKSATPVAGFQLMICPTFSTPS